MRKPIFLLMPLLWAMLFTLIGCSNSTQMQNESKTANLSSSEDSVLIYKDASNTCAERKEQPTRDSLLIYKVEGMKLFMNFSVDLYGGRDDAQYWAFMTADSLLNAIDYQSYEESLALYYSAVSYINNGLSYVPTIMRIVNQSDANPESGLPSISLEESFKLIIEDPKLSETNRLKDLSGLEYRALYSTFYYTHVIGMDKFVSLVKPILEEFEEYEKYYSSYSIEDAYKLCSIESKALWYIFLSGYSLDAFRLFRARKYSNKYGDLFQTYIKRHVSGNKYETLLLSDDEFALTIDEIAVWHDSIQNFRNDGIENLSDEKFYEIELKAARYHYYMLSVANECVKLMEEFKETQEELRD